MPELTKESVLKFRSDLISETHRTAQGLKGTIFTILEAAGISGTQFEAMKSLIGQRISTTEYDLFMAQLDYFIEYHLVEIPEIRGGDQNQLPEPKKSKK